MRKPKALTIAFGLLFGYLLGGIGVAQAQCTLPYPLTNGQVADATQVMADFNAVVTCLSPGGSPNAIQYNAGGSPGGVGPLTDGQLAIGSTGNAPQGAALTAGSGISITNGPGSVTIAATGGGGGSSWQVVTANTTAVPGGMYLADTSAGPFTITLPTSGVVQIADAKGTFGTSNLTIAAANGQTLSGQTYSGASTVVLNAPGNNAMVFCGTSTAFVQQVANGVWGRTSVAAVTNVQWTGLPTGMNWEIVGQSITNSASSILALVVGTGSGPTYIGTGYAGYTSQVGGGRTSWSIYAPLDYAQESSLPNLALHATVVSNIGTNDYININGFFGGNASMFDGNVQPGAALSAIKLYFTSGNITGTFTLRWSKGNV